jgi:hypothetical protein
MVYIVNLDISSPANLKKKIDRITSTPFSELNTTVGSCTAGNMYATTSKKKENRIYFNKENIVTDSVMKTLSMNKDSDIKPSLNCVESRNRLFEYSKSKKYKEDQTYFGSKAFTNPENDEDDKDDLEKQAFKKKIDDIIKNLPVPLDKKNDEKFKIKAIGKMRSEKKSANKSARQSEINERIAHQEEFKISNIF